MTYGSGAYGDDPAPPEEPTVYDADPLNRSVGDLSTHVAAAIAEIRRLEAEIADTQWQAKQFAEDLMKEAQAHNATRAEIAQFEQQHADDRLTIADLQRRLADCEAR